MKKVQRTSGWICLNVFFVLICNALSHVPILIYEAEPGQLLNFYGKWAESTLVIMTTLKKEAFTRMRHLLCSLQGMLCGFSHSATRDGIMLLVQYHNWSMIFSPNTALWHHSAYSGHILTRKVWRIGNMIYMRCLTQFAMPFQVGIIVNKSVYTCEGISL